MGTVTGGKFFWMVITLEEDAQPSHAWKGYALDSQKNQYPVSFTDLEINEETGQISGENSWYSG